MQQQPFVVHEAVEIGTDIDGRIELALVSKATWAGSAVVAAAELCSGGGGCRFGLGGFCEQAPRARAIPATMASGFSDGTFIWDPYTKLVGAPKPRLVISNPEDRPGAQALETTAEV